MTAFTASLLINAGVLFSLDQAAVHQESMLRIEQQQRIARRGAESIHFEFVEAPHSPPAPSPKKSHRISDRDALNRDLTRDKSSAETAPSAKILAPNDQLAQHQGNALFSPNKASPEIAVKPPMTPQKPNTRHPAKSPGETLKEPVSASRPSPAIQGLTEQDRITVSEVSRIKSHGAQLYGITSFEATGSGMGKYMKNLKEKIWMAWFPYLAVHYPKDFKSADAIVSFTLNARGEVRTVQLVEKKGSPLFAAFCMESVRRAGPFGPLPREILDLVGKDELEIKFAFHYW